MLIATGTVLVLLTFLQNTVSSDFDDLGRWLFGGFAAAVVLAIGVVVIKRRTADKDSPSHFISIAVKGDDNGADSDHK